MKDEPNGLYQKYLIHKADGSPVDPEARYVVLRVDNHGTLNEHDRVMREAARQAVCLLAGLIQAVAPELSKDLHILVGSSGQEDTQS